MSGIISQSRLGQYDVLKPDDNYLGTVRKFMDKDWSVPDGVALRSGCWITAVYVKNDSGGELTKSLGVKFKDTALGLSLGGLSGADGRCDGVIDPFLPGTGLPNGSYGWIIVSGPCDVVIGTSGVSQGEAIQTAASGKFIALTDGNTYASGRAGIANAAISQDATGRVWLNLAYQALIPGFCA